MPHARHSSARTTAVAALIACLSLLTPAAPADTIQTRDGRTLVGYITDLTDQSITIYARHNGSETTHTIRRQDIASITMGPVPPGQLTRSREQVFELLNPEPAPEPPVASRAAPDRYAIVPIHGPIGYIDETSGVLVTGVREALLWAARSGVKHIVLDIDSVSGSIAEAREIRALLDQHADRFTYTAYIRNAAGPAMWLVLNSDTILVATSAPASGILSYHRLPVGPPPEAEAMQLTVLASELGSIARSKGHNTDIVRAMILPQAILYEWTDHAGRTLVGAAVPAGITAAAQLDTPDITLTLTTQEAARIGLARAAHSPPTDINDLLSIPAWHNAGGYPEIAIRRAAQKLREVQQAHGERLAELERTIDTARSIAATIPALIRTAEDLDPQRFDYFVNRETLQMTPSSLQEWRANTDNALKAWDTVLETIRTVEDKEAELRKLQRTLGFDQTRATDRPALVAHAARAEREIERHRANRHRIGG